MHPIALIVSLVLVIIGIVSICNPSEDDDNSQKEQFEQNVNKTTGGVISPNKNFGPGFGLAIAALIFMLISMQKSKFNC
ncbi:unnamed protein product [Rhizophagus irregularis]|uniref:Uncharacterized protein n=1 Tax=Rhizophagus irregularis TaxID=588596 RepID=A0A2N1NE84_9GLOM|nr:hypothetical protein RhiirC2_777438 [Rhizophagus irregularis]CAB4399919.1 unnamed protein product [Rhizophagus irregularis]CAB5392897.1 unnamed protein product [Rhizophagus irregularis]